MYLSMYKIEGSENLDSHYCFGDKTAFPKFQEKLENLRNFLEFLRKFLEILRKFLENRRKFLEILRQMLENPRKSGKSKKIQENPEKANKVFQDRWTDRHRQKIH